jgi:hypothetical protein
VECNWVVICQRLTIIDQCDGNTPCGRCAAQSQDCHYESEAGVPRTQALKRKNEALSEDNTQLRYIVQGLRYGNEQEATEILRRIRATQDADEAVAAITEASLLVKPSWASLPAFGPLQPGQVMPHVNPDIAGGSSPEEGRSRLASGRIPQSADAEPGSARSSSSAAPLGGRDSSAPVSNFFQRRGSRSTNREPYGDSQYSWHTSTSTTPRPSVRWTPWTPSSISAVGAASSQPQGIAQRLNES